VAMLKLRAIRDSFHHKVEIMKIIFIFISFFTTIISKGQETIKVTLVDHKTTLQLTLPTNFAPIVSLISNDESGKRKMKIYNVNERGQFTFHISDLDLVGDNFTFSVNSFNDFKLFNYADFEIKNIPKDSAEIVPSNVYLMPAYWTNSCGFDCFLIDNRRTFKKKEFIMTTPFISYKVRRLPEKINQSLLNVKYVSDLKQDIMK
jgi:hypothetical protein